MRPDVAAAFDRLAAAAARGGDALVVNSAYRSDAEQARLFAAHPDPRWVAPPGQVASPLRDRARPRAVVRLRVAGRQRAPVRLREALLLGALALRLHAGPAPCSAPATRSARPAGGETARSSAGLPGFVPARFRAPIAARRRALERLRRRCSPRS